MWLAIVSDAVVAVFCAFAIIYSLAFSFYCIFVSGEGKRFSLEQMKHIIGEMAEREKNDGRS